MKRMGFLYRWQGEGFSVVSECEDRLVVQGSRELQVWLPQLCESDQFHHAALPRMRGTMLASLGEGLKGEWLSPLVALFHLEAELGAQPYGFFPPLTLFRDKKAIIQVGPLTEDSLRISYAWEFQHGMILTIRLSDAAGNNPASDEGETLELRSWPDGLGPRLGPDLFRPYVNEIAASLDRPSPASKPFWGTWNDGGFRAVSEERVLKMADWLTQNCPEVGWVQIDDGWAGPSSAVSGEGESLGMSHLGAFYHPEELQGDRRFPSGLDGLASQIKAKGLRPMIWLTGAVEDHSPLYKDHPEWFIEGCRLHFVPQMRFLDPSVPAARDYVRKLLDLVFGQWGFEGCKLDFWTMPFEQPDAKYRGQQTLAEAMAWFAQEIRDRLPADGLFMHCIDLPFGAPFRSQWFQQFRFYSDSEGLGENQEMMREQALWTAVLTGLYGIQKLWQPDGDGLGIFDHGGMSDANFRRWCALLAGSGTLTELAGYLAEKPDHPRVPIVLRTAKLAAGGLQVDLPGYDWETGGAPLVWSREDGVLAITNWSDEPIAYPLGDPRMEVLRNQTMGPDVVLPPGDGMLFAPGQ